MNVVIFEYITGGGMLDQDVTSSLLFEAELMVSALFRDFSNISDVNVRVLRDYRLNNNHYLNSQITVTETRDFIKCIKQNEDSIDALIVIAPEKGQTLLKICQSFSNNNFILLNCDHTSLEITSNKLHTYNHLLSYGIEQIPTTTIENPNSIVADDYVIKPIDGVGCEDIQILHGKSTMLRSLDLLENKNYIIQPYIRGKDASICALFCNGAAKIFCCNWQNIILTESTISLESCDVNSFANDKLQNLVNEIARALPGLKGYVGIDVLLLPNKVILVEINPRLTTSYAGIKEATGCNPADLILSVFLDRKLPVVNYINEKTIRINIDANHAA